MLYDLPTFTGIIGFMQWVNTITGYLFGPLVVLAFFIVMVISMKNFETEKAYAASSLSTAVLCFFFLLINLTSVHHVMIAAINFIVSVVILYTSRPSV